MTPPAPLAQSLYEALKDHPACRELDNEQIEAIAHHALLYLQSESYRVVRQESVGWGNAYGCFHEAGDAWGCPKDHELLWKDLP